MALTNAELVVVAEITRETFDVVAAKAPALNAEQEAAVREDLEAWALVRDDYAKLTGKVGLDPEWEREAIRQRVRKALGLPLYSYEAVSGGAPVVGAYVGGVSRSGKSTVESDSDRVRPVFSRELFE